MSYMTIEEAWGETPIRQSLPPNSSTLSYEDMNALQGYNYATCQTDTRNIATYIDDHNINNTTKNNANIEEFRELERKSAQTIRVKNLVYIILKVFNSVILILILIRIQLF